MLIMDQDGQILKGLAGPFNEASSLALTCQTMGGELINYGSVFFIMVTPKQKKSKEKSISN